MKKRVFGRKEQPAFGGHISGSRNTRNDEIIVKLNLAFKDRAQYAFLHPYLARRQLVVGIKTGHLRARSSSAGRAVIRFPWAEHEISAVRSRRLRGREQFNVVNLFAVAARDSVHVQSGTHGPGEFRENLHIFQR